jgi:hypothetical protein
MHFEVLALDYDGTIAIDGSVADSNKDQAKVGGTVEGPAACRETSNVCIFAQRSSGQAPVS